MISIFIFLFSAMGISFLCSILESALMSTPLSYVNMREDEGYKPAQRFKAYKTNSARPIAAILSLNTIANTIGAAGVGAMTTKEFGPEWLGVVSAITTILILVFSEIIPKTIGTTQWKHLMGFTAGTLRIIIVMIFPIVWVVEKFSKTIAPDDDDEATVSREEVAAMADMAEDEEVIDEDENKIIQNVIKLDDVKAEDVMTPTTVAEIAPEKMTLKEFYKIKSYSHFSRIPVYTDSDEYITGYVLRSEVLELLADDKFDMTLGEIKREIPLFNEKMSLSDVWDEMMKQKEHISCVIDEYGSFQGILTLEDIIETIFGLEIIDERDDVADMQQYARECWQKRQSRFKEIQIPE
ncbi:MAG: CNNM domain-containing protein [Bacteroidales bacterium]|nr:CNNM domain-containing protein [Bacteroidales bacterium]